MSETKKIEITIEEVFEEFLKAHAKLLKPKTLHKNEEVVGLFKESLNGYAYQYLDEKESALFDKLYEARSKKHREFCEIFGS